MTISAEIKKYTLSATINGRIVIFSQSDIAGDVNFNGFRANNVGDPLAPKDAANKEYVDGKLGATTAVNVGTGGGEIFKAKVGDDIQLRTLKGDPGLIVTTDTDYIRLGIEYIDCGVFP